MTEAEWQAGVDVLKMLWFVADSSERKERLVACACGRSVWPLLKNAVERDNIGVGERLADGLASDDERHDGFQAAIRDEITHDAPYQNTAAGAANAAVFYDANEAARAAAGCAPEAAARAGWAQASVDSVAIVRCVFGNPFRPVAVDPAWRTPPVAHLAAAVYEERHLPSGRFDNSRLGVLADALEDAGCDQADLLGHLRGGDHIRGCWAVDLVLGKE